MSIVQQYEDDQYYFAVACDITNIIPQVQSVEVQVGTVYTLSALP